MFKRLVRWATSWAWREEIALKEGLVQLEELHAKPGGLELAIRHKPEMAQYIAQCFAELVAKSPNYTQMDFDLVAKREDGYQWLTVLIQKGSGKTPHALRLEAEQKLAIAESRLKSMIEGDKQLEPKNN